MTVPTISITHLAELHCRLGVVPPPVVVCAAVGSSSPAPLAIIGRPAEQQALRAVNDARTLIRPLTCYFVRDITVSGAGYVFHGEEQVTDGSHLSDVAVEWVKRPMPDSPLAAPPAVETFVKGLCIVAVGPGHLIYGHWLIDFIPRFMIARAALGREFDAAKVALPSDTPAWALAMLKAFAGVTPDRCVFYQRGVERLAIADACVPGYCHTDYHLHPYASEIYSQIGGPAPGAANRKLCISRVAFEAQTHGQQKLFATRVRFEAVARDAGYEIVRPENLSLFNQVALFRAASHVIGEYGSALHSTVFSPVGCRVGFIRCPNPIQFRISARCQQYSVVALPREDHVASSGVQEYSLSDDEMDAFFLAMNKR